jgi:transposase-like protein
MHWGGKTLAEFAQQFDVHPNHLTDWRKQLLERAAGVTSRHGPIAVDRQLHRDGRLTSADDARRVQAAL